jgi:hypothetical protein
MARPYRADTWVCPYTIFSKPKKPFFVFSAFGAPTINNAHSTVSLLNSFLLLGNVSYIRNNPLVLKENRFPWSSAFGKGWVP